MRRRLFLALGCLGLVGAVAWATWPAGYKLDAADKPFDQSLGHAMNRGGVIDLRLLEPGDWTQVCGVGEGTALDRLKDAGLPTAAAPGETGITELFDHGSASPADQASSAFVFVGRDGAQVRPVSGLHILSGGALDVCVDRAQAKLISDVDGWRLGARR